MISSFTITVRASHILTMIWKKLHCIWTCFQEMTILTATLRRLKIMNCFLPNICHVTHLKDFVQDKELSMEETSILERYATFSSSKRRWNLYLTAYLTLRLPKRDSNSLSNLVMNQISKMMKGTSSVKTHLFCME